MTITLSLNNHLILYFCQFHKLITKFFPELYSILSTVPHVVYVWVNEANPGREPPCSG